MAKKVKAEVDPSQCPFVSEGDPYGVRALRQALHKKLGGRLVFHSAQDEPELVRSSIIALNWGMTGNFVVLIRPSADQIETVLSTYKAGRITASGITIEYSGKYLDRRMALFKEASKHGRFKELTYIRAGQDSDELHKHITQWSKSKGITFSPEASRYLHENFPTMIMDVRSSTGNKNETEVYDLQTADSEITKLLPIIGDSNNVTLEMLQEFCSFDADKGLFSMIKSITSGNMPKVYAIAERDFFGAKKSLISNALRALRNSLYLSYMCKLQAEKYGEDCGVISRALNTAEYRDRFTDWSQTETQSTSEDDNQPKKSKLDLPDWRIKFILKDCAGSNSDRLFRGLIATECGIIDTTADLDPDLIFHRVLATCFNYDVYRQPFSDKFGCKALSFLTY